MKIITYPNPTLEKQSKEVEIPLKLEDKILISKMYKTVQDKGIGLAAPQVGVSKQICIVVLDPDLADKKDKKLEFVMINPKLIFKSQVASWMIEGCLSFPEQFYEIERPSNIQVRFQTISNFKEVVKNPETKAVLKTETIKASKWMSRVIQHEVDHLHGNLFIHMGGKKISQQELSGKQVID